MTRTLEIVEDDVVVRLSSKPADTVTVTLSWPGSQLTVSPATLTFTTTSWKTSQTVTVGAVNDAAAEGAHSATVGFALASAGDPAYNRSVPGHVVSIADND